MNTLTAKARCTRCGGTQLIPQHAGQPRDKDKLTCASCGHQFQLEASIEESRKAIEKALADQLRRLSK